MTANRKLEEHHGLQLVGVESHDRLQLRIVEPAHPDQQQSEGLGESEHAHQRGESEDAGHVPAHRARRHGRVVIGDRHDRNVVEQCEAHDHDRRERLKLENDDGRDNGDHDVEGHRDAIVDIALDALENLPRDANGVDDGG